MFSEKLRKFPALEKGAYYKTCVQVNPALLFYNLLYYHHAVHIFIAVGEAASLLLLA